MTAGSGPPLVSTVAPWVEPEPVAAKPKRGRARACLGMALYFCFVQDMQLGFRRFLPVVDPKRLAISPHEFERLQHDVAASLAHFPVFVVAIAFLVQGLRKSKAPNLYSYLALFVAFGRMITGALVVGIAPGVLLRTEGPIRWPDTILLGGWMLDLWGLLAAFLVSEAFWRSKLTSGVTAEWRRGPRA